MKKGERKKCSVILFNILSDEQCFNIRTEVQKEQLGNIFRLTTDIVNQGSS